MTDQQFTKSANTIAALILAQGERMDLSPDILCNLAGAALAQVLGAELGPVGAIERIRLIADQLERQFI